MWLYLTVIISDSRFTDGIPKDRDREAICPVVHWSSWKSVVCTPAFMILKTVVWTPWISDGPSHQAVQLLPSRLLCIHPYIFLPNPSLPTFYSKDGWSRVSNTRIYSHPLCFAHFFWMPAAQRMKSKLSTLLVNLFSIFPTLSLTVTMLHILLLATPAKCVFKHAVLFVRKLQSPLLTQMAFVV